ncbi:hypothetical protein [Streptomyces triculaminicus]
MTRMDDLPVRDELRGRSPYGAPEGDEKPPPAVAGQRPQPVEGNTV